MKRNKTEGRLILKEIKLEDIYPRKVTKNNKTSGKVTLPLDLVGKEVYVIVPEGKNPEGKNIGDNHKV